MVMKKLIVHNFYFYSHKKINKQKTYKMKKKKTKYQTNIFLSWENYLFFILEENEWELRAGDNKFMQE